jgi:multidrug efflux pump subunit AcrB
VAEIHGPDAETRRQVATKMTQLFAESDLVTDVDNFMRAADEYWNFRVDIQKAARQGVSVTAINQHLAMAMGGFKVIDLKQPGVQEPTWITLFVPLQKRAQLPNLNNMPISTMDGRTIPLAELGQFEKLPRREMIFHKDLRPVEFVVGDTTGSYAAPIYAMLDIEERLKGYKTPDGVTLQPHYTAAPAHDRHSAFEWSGEWTVTFETFRDLGTAFIVALIAIYMLVVWQFGNFLIPAIIMAPIPLTLLGIVPGHWMLGADFTATSMIGWIALAGIIVRNSILLVDFTIHQVHLGEELVEAVIMAVKARTRPILITALALVLGASVIITDPIFQGMAISLLFGVFVSTILTLFVIPLGCVSLGQQIFMESKE